MKDVGIYWANPEAYDDSEDDEEDAESEGEESENPATNLDDDSEDDEEDEETEGEENENPATNLDETSLLTNLVYVLTSGEDSVRAAGCVSQLYHWGRRYNLSRAALDYLRGRFLPGTYLRLYGPGPVDWWARFAFYAWQLLLAL